jgi:hypothetical protein
MPHTKNQLFTIALIDLDKYFTKKMGTDVDSFTPLIGDNGCFTNEDQLENFLLQYVNPKYGIRLKASNVKKADIGGLANAIAAAASGK